MAEDEIWYNPDKYPEHWELVNDAFALLFQELMEYEAREEQFESESESLQSERELRERLNKSEYRESAEYSRRIREGKSPEETVEYFRLRNAEASGQRAKRRAEIKAMCQTFEQRQHGDLELVDYQKIVQIFTERARNAASKLIDPTLYMLTGVSYIPNRDPEACQEQIRRMTVYANACAALTGTLNCLDDKPSYPFD